MADSKGGGSNLLLILLVVVMAMYVIIAVILHDHPGAGVTASNSPVHYGVNETTYVVNGDTYSGTLLGQLTFAEDLYCADFCIQPGDSFPISQYDKATIKAITKIAKHCGLDVSDTQVSNHLKNSVHIFVLDSQHDIVALGK